MLSLLPEPIKNVSIELKNESSDIHMKDKNDNNKNKKSDKMEIDESESKSDSKSNNKSDKSNNNNMDDEKYNINNLNVIGTGFVTSLYANRIFFCNIMNEHYTNENLIPEIVGLEKSEYKQYNCIVRITETVQYFDELTDNTLQDYVCYYENNELDISYFVMGIEPPERLYNKLVIIPKCYVTITKKRFESLIDLNNIDFINGEFYVISHNYNRRIITIKLLKNGEFKFDKNETKYNFVIPIAIHKKNGLKQTLPFWRFTRMRNRKCQENEIFTCNEDDDSKILGKIILVETSHILTPNYEFIDNRYDNIIKRCVVVSNTGTEIYKAILLKEAKQNVPYDKRYYKVKCFSVIEADDIKFIAVNGEFIKYNDNNKFDLWNNKTKLNSLFNQEITIHEQFLMNITFFQNKFKNVTAFITTQPGEISVYGGIFIEEKMINNIKLYIIKITRSYIYDWIKFKNSFLEKVEFYFDQNMVSNELITVYPYQRRFPDIIGCRVGVEAWYFSSS